MNGSKSEITEQKLLECARLEFLEKGFSHANMRTIAGKAGMTTGAIYRYFADKNTLFRAVVEPAAHEIKNYFTELAHVQLHSLEQSGQMETFDQAEAGLMHIIDYIYSNFETLDLLINRSVGSEYEHFVNSLIEIDLISTQAYIRKLAAFNQLTSSPPAHYLHLLLSHNYKQILEIVTQGMNREEAVSYLRMLMPFLYGGWSALLSQRER